MLNILLGISFLSLPVFLCNKEYGNSDFETYIYFLQTRNLRQMFLLNLFSSFGLILFGLGLCTIKII